MTGSSGHADKFDTCLMEKKILFIDDNLEILRVYKVVAMHRDYMPYCAPNGAEALNIMAQNQIRVCCLDLLMPGMDGVELCRQMRKLNPFTCIYAVSGYAGGHKSDELHSAGFDGFFEKPVRWELLFKTLHAAFEKINQWDQQNGAASNGTPPSAPHSSAAAEPDKAGVALELSENAGGSACTAQSALASETTHARSRDLTKEQALPIARFCPHDHACTESKEFRNRPLCRVRSEHEVNRLCLSTTAPETCPYRMAFGPSEFCCCPRHHAMYRQRGR